MRRTIYKQQVIGDALDVASRTCRQKLQDQVANTKP